MNMKIKDSAYLLGFTFRAPLDRNGTKSNKIKIIIFYCTINTKVTP